jgi:hypothetical protein
MRPIDISLAGTIAWVSWKLLGQYEMSALTFLRIVGRAQITHLGGRRHVHDKRRPRHGRGHLRARHTGLDFAGGKIACRFRPISELLGARAGASVFPMAAWVPTAGEQSAKSEGVHDVCRAM